VAIVSATSPSGIRVRSTSTLACWQGPMAAGRSLTPREPVSNRSVALDHAWCQGPHAASRRWSLVRDVGALLLPGQSRGQRDSTGGYSEPPMAAAPVHDHRTCVLARNHPWAGAPRQGTQTIAPGRVPLAPPSGADLDTTRRPHARGRFNPFAGICHGVRGTRRGATPRKAVSLRVRVRALGLITGPSLWVSRVPWPSSAREPPNRAGLPPDDHGSRVETAGTARCW
jgi:hypothetical protein